MSFNKRYLPEKEELERRRIKTNDDRKFLKEIIGRSEVLLGPPGSTNYIEEVGKIVESYDKLIKSGMFFELYPNLTGTWELDKNQWEQEFLKKID